MNESLHPAASHHLPSFITAPGETDVLMVMMSIILVLGVMGFGSLFFRLHTICPSAWRTRETNFNSRLSPFWGFWLSSPTSICSGWQVYCLR